MLTAFKTFGLGRAAAVLAIGFLVAAPAAWALILWMIPPYAVRLNVRWTPDVDASARAGLERQLGLTQGEPTEGTTFVYYLEAPTTDRIRALVQHPSVDDTAHINRIRFRPELAQDRERRAILYAVPTGAIVACGVMIWLVTGRGTPALR